MPQWNSRSQSCGPQVVEGARDRLVTLSRQIHDNPELCFEETYAAPRWPRPWPTAASP